MFRKSDPQLDKIVDISLVTDFFLILLAGVIAGYVVTIHPLGRSIWGSFDYTPIRVNRRNYGMKANNRPIRVYRRNYGMQANNRPIRVYRRNYGMQANNRPIRVNRRNYGMQANNRLLHIRLVHSTHIRFNIN